MSNLQKHVLFKEIQTSHCSSQVKIILEYYSYLAATSKGPIGLVKDIPNNTIVAEKST